MSEDSQGFLSEETERKIAEFKAKLEAEQAALPDTSIRSGTGKIDAPKNYYFDNESIPIYDTTLNKRIDRVDMEIDRAKRMRRTQLAEELDRYKSQIHAENERQNQAGGESQTSKGSNETASFIYIVPGILVVFGIIVVVAMSLI